MAEKRLHYFKLVNICNQVTISYVTLSAFVKKCSKCKTSRTRNCLIKGYCKINYETSPQTDTFWDLIWGQIKTFRITPPIQQVDHQPSHVTHQGSNLDHTMDKPVSSTEPKSAEYSGNTGFIFKLMSLLFKHKLTLRFSKGRHVQIFKPAVYNSLWQLNNKTKDNKISNRD